MRSIHTIHIGTIASGILILQGCTSHQPIAQIQETQVQLNPSHIPAETQDQILAELFELLLIKLEPSTQTIQVQSTPPQLVAGDWLAWQCAIVGSYWDLPQTNAPTFAEALESIPLN